MSRRAGLYRRLKYDHRHIITVLSLFVICVLMLTLVLLVKLCVFNSQSLFKQPMQRKKVTPKQIINISPHHLYYSNRTPSLHVILARARKGRKNARPFTPLLIRSRSNTQHIDGSEVEELIMKLVADDVYNGNFFYETPSIVMSILFQFFIFFVVRRRTYTR